MATNYDMPSGDEVLAHIITFLLDGDEKEPALVLLGSNVEVQLARVWNDRAVWNLTFRGSRVFVNLMRDEGNDLRSAIITAINEAVAAFDADLEELDFVFQKIDFDFGPDWRKELDDIARGKDISNQGAGVDPEKVRTWQHLRFRSMAEVRIAEALERAGVMFFPNCRARLNTPVGRRTREPDFLVCSQGKWGVLEVDGSEFHPATRTVEDHARDRLFKLHGVQTVHHFDAGECYNEPDRVVAEFLQML